MDQAPALSVAFLPSHRANHKGSFLLRNCSGTILGPALELAPGSGPEPGPNLFFGRLFLVFSWMNCDVMYWSMVGPCCVCLLLGSVAFSALDLFVHCAVASSETGASQMHLQALGKVPRVSSMTKKCSKVNTVHILSTQTNGINSYTVNSGSSDLE